MFNSLPEIEMDTSSIPPKIYALVDCNNFYVSCERVFDLKARSKPTVVLSNNDGCIIARSPEVKAMGVRMADPVYKWINTLEKNNTSIYSSNFPLYADISDRVMSILYDFAPEIEQYSIDEAFLNLTNMPIRNYKEYAAKIRQTVLDMTDIPVSVGIANTKTLAKAANRIGKKFPQFNGILSFKNAEEAQVDSLLEMLEIEDVWGIGSKYSSLLKSKGITNAKILKYADLNFIKKYLHIPGVRTVLELKGISCIPFMEETNPKKGILSSKSFSSPVDNLESLTEAIANYTARGAEKLRNQNSATGKVSVFIRTNHFNAYASQYSNSYRINLPHPTFDTAELIYYAIKALKKIYIKGYRYHKAGVYFDSIIQQDNIPFDLFGEVTRSSIEKKKALMNCVDRINFKWGRDTVFFATQGVKRDWKMKQSKKSPCYTTSIKELLLVK